MNALSVDNNKPAMDRARIVVIMWRELNCLNSLNSIICHESLH